MADGPLKLPLAGAVLAGLHSSIVLLPPESWRARGGPAAESCPGWGPPTVPCVEVAWGRAASDLPGTVLHCRLAESPVECGVSGAAAMCCSASAPHALQLSPPPAPCCLSPFHTQHPSSLAPWCEPGCSLAGGGGSGSQKRGERANCWLPFPVSPASAAASCRRSSSSSSSQALLRSPLSSSDSVPEEEANCCLKAALGSFKQRQEETKPGRPQGGRL